MENSFVILKEKFGSLKELSFRMLNEQNKKECNDWIMVCCILHNILISFNNELLYKTYQIFNKCWICKLLFSHILKNLTEYNLIFFEQRVSPEKFLQIFKINFENHGSVRETYRPNSVIWVFLKFNFSDIS